MSLAPYLSFPQLDSLVVYCATVSNYEGRLSPSERAIVQHAVEKRRREFATGRLCAHQGIVAITGGIDAVITSDAERRPVWPTGICGSITHTDETALAVVARSSQYAGLGIDAEVISRVSEDLWPRLLRKEEIAGLNRRSDAAVKFSAKEAVYKAINPLVGEFIGFQEVSIKLDPSLNEFTVAYHGEHEPNRRLETGRGHFRVEGDLAICLFIIGNRL